MKKVLDIIPRGIPCIVIVLLLFGYLGSVMGLSNMLNTIMKTAHGLLLNTVFYLMGICVITGALGKVFTEFGVVELLQLLLKKLVRPLYNLPGVAILGGMMTFLSDNPAIISLSKNKKFASYFKVYQFISLANFGTAFGMGLLVIVFMVGQGYFSAPFIGLAGAACGGVIATRLMQYLILKKHPEYKDMDVVSKEELTEEDKLHNAASQSDDSNGVFIRTLNALLDGGKSGVEIGLAIIPGVLIICTLVMMFTFGGTVEGVDAQGKDIVVYTGAAYQGCGLLPWLAGKVNFLFDWLFGFTAPELIAFPITALGAVGAALSLIPEFTLKGIIDGNAVAVFTAMGMCWSGFLSTHTAMLDSMGYRHLLTRDFLSQILGGIGAGVIAHWLYVAIMAISSLFVAAPVWNTQVEAVMCNEPKTVHATLTALDDGSYTIRDWFGVKGTELSFTVSPKDKTVAFTNAYANKDNRYFFVRINEHAEEGEPAYAALYPVERYSEFDGSRKSGYFWCYCFVYNNDHKIIDEGYYEVDWGGSERQTAEAEAKVMKRIRSQRAAAH